MISLILTSFWLFLPAGIANMSPVLFKWLPFFNIPVDFNKTFHNKPILGTHKTYRGFIMGILFATLMVYSQKLAYPYLDNYSFVDYSQINIFFLGLTLGGGALLGDAIASFLKRRLDISPGSSWIPFDQIDWIVGGLVLTSLYISIPLSMTVIILLLFTILHFIMDSIAFALKLK